LKYLIRIVQRVRKRDTTLKLSTDNMIVDSQVYEAAVNGGRCYFCVLAFEMEEGDSFTDNKETQMTVMHHDHLKCQFLGLAHSIRNLQANQKIEFPVYIHNFASYDSFYRSSSW